MPASDWADLCVQTIVWRAVTGRDATSQPTYGAAVLFSPPNGGRRVYKTVRRASAGFPKEATAPQGAAADFVQVSYIWILATPAIQQGDLVYVQGDVAPYPVVIGVDRYPDENGDLFVKVTMGDAIGT